MHILLQNTELESVFAEMPREAFEDERYARDSGLPLRTNTNANTNMDLNRNNVLGKCFDAYKEHKLTEMLHVFSFFNRMIAE